MQNETLHKVSYTSNIGQWTFLCYLPVLSSQAQPLVNMYGILWIMWMKVHTNYKCLLTTGQIVIITTSCCTFAECLQARRGMFSHWRSTLQGRVGCARGRYVEASLYRCPVHVEWGQHEGSHTCPYQWDHVWLMLTLVGCLSQLEWGLRVGATLVTPHQAPAPACVLYALHFAAGRTIFCKHRFLWLS